MFQRTVPVKTLTYSIDSDLIAIGSTTWQTKNLTSVSISSHLIPFNISQPTLPQNQPKREFKWLWLFVAITLCWTWAASFSNPARIGIPGTILACAAIWFIGHYAHKHKLSLWQREAERARRQSQEFAKAKAESNTIYSLVLDSSSGKSIALSSFKPEEIIPIHDAIIHAMRSRIASPLHGTITALEPSIPKIEEAFINYVRRQIDAA